MHRRGLGRSNTAPPSMGETRSEDGLVLLNADVNLEKNLLLFESKSSFERANSFAGKSEPVEYEWVSIGHGRFMKREVMNDNFDHSDFVDL